tara:strand:+ start:969 stop:1268 length:300 start_codon:yes stop_codon:yes gene_type:complete
MVYRTEQDKINRKEANQRYYKLEENKEQKRNYMKDYSKREYVKTKKKEYYKNNKLKWGGKRDTVTIYPYHEEWAKKNGYRDNDALNTKNTVGFKDSAER